MTSGDGSTPIRPRFRSRRLFGPGFEPGTNSTRRFWSLVTQAESVTCAPDAAICSTTSSKAHELKSSSGAAAVTATNSRSSAGATSSNWETRPLCDNLGMIAKDVAGR